MENKNIVDYCRMIFLNYEEIVKTINSSQYLDKTIALFGMVIFENQIVGKKYDCI